MRKIILITVISLMCFAILKVIVNSASEPTDTSKIIIATYRGGVVTQKDLDGKINSLPIWERIIAQEEKEPIEWKKELVKEIVRDRLLTVEAQKENILRSPIFKRKLEKEKKQALLNALYRQEVIDKATVTETELRQYYQDHIDEYSTPEQFSIRHIFVDTSRKRTTETEKIEAHKKIMEALEELKAGEPFAKVAKKYSESEPPEQRGEPTKMFKKGEILKEIEEAALSLSPGQYTSSIITTKHGYNIVYLEKYIPTQIRFFEEVKPQIQAKLVQEKRAQLANNFKEEAIKKAKIKKNYQLLEKENVPDSAVLLEVNKWKYTFGDFKLDATLPELRNRLSTLEEKKAFLDNLAENEVLVQVAEQFGLETAASVQESIAKFKERELPRQMLELKINKRLKITEEELLDYYNKNTAWFIAPKEILARNIMIRAKIDPKASPRDQRLAMQAALDTCKMILEKIKAGADFAEMARLYSDDPNAAKGGYIGWVHMGPMGRRFDMAAFKLGKGEVSEPVEMRDGYMLIKVEDIRESRQLTFSEAKDKVKEAVKAIKTRELAKTITEEMVTKANLQFVAPEFQEVKPAKPEKLEEIKEETPYNP